MRSESSWEVAVEAVLAVAYRDDPRTGVRESTLALKLRVMQEAPLLGTASGTVGYWEAMRYLWGMGSLPAGIDLDAIAAMERYGSTWIERIGGLHFAILNLSHVAYFGGTRPALTVVQAVYDAEGVEDYHDALLLLERMGAEAVA